MMLMYSSTSNGEHGSQLLKRQKGKVGIVKINMIVNQLFVHSREVGFQAFSSKLDVPRLADGHLQRPIQSCFSRRGWRLRP